MGQTSVENVPLLMRCFRFHCPLNSLLRRSSRSNNRCLCSSEDVCYCQALVFAHHFVQFLLERRFILLKLNVMQLFNILFFYKKLPFSLFVSKVDDGNRKNPPPWLEPFKNNGDCVKLRGGVCCACCNRLFVAPAALIAAAFAIAILIFHFLAFYRSPLNNFMLYIQISVIRSTVQFVCFLIWIILEIRDQSVAFFLKNAWSCKYCFLVFFPLFPYEQSLLHRLLFKQISSFFLSTKTIIQKAFYHHWRLKRACCNCRR